MRTISLTLGAATALLGTKAAMTCTAAVEDVIVDHYERFVEFVNV